MELLVILLGEFLLFPVIAAAGTFFNFCLTICSIFLEFLFSLIADRSDKKHINKTQSQKRVLPLKLIAKISGIVCSVFILALFTVNIVFFAPTMTMIASHIAQKTKSEITFSSVQGNVFTGEITFTDLRALKANDDGFQFDLDAKHVFLNIDIFSLLSSPIVVETLHIDDVHGDIDDNRKNEVLEESQSYAVVQNSPKKLKAKKAFIIQDLALNNLTFTLRKGAKDPLSVFVDYAESAPLRSQYAIFDTFFRSDVEGNINGHALKIASRAVDDGRETMWHLDHFPISLVGQYVDKAPINWFERGVIDIRVQDEWQRGENAEIDMDWSFVLKDAYMRAPEGSSILSRAALTPVAAYINRRENDLDISFSLLINKNKFEGASSLDASGLWDAVLDGMAKKLAATTGSKKQDIKDGVHKGIGRFKNFLNKKRDSNE